MRLLLLAGDIIILYLCDYIAHYSARISYTSSVDCNLKITELVSRANNRLIRLYCVNRREIRIKSY